ncbi:MAG: cation:proton antiporter [Gemmataceae bacterium]
MSVGWRCRRCSPRTCTPRPGRCGRWSSSVERGHLRLIGFQLPAVLSDLRGDHTPGFLAGAAALVAAVVILTRFLWMFPGAYVPRWLDRRLFGKGDPYPPWQNVSVVAWTGMRGVVSLAAALAIPREKANGELFPDRGLIQFLTFWVIFATLVGQGLTLPLLIRWLGVDKRADAEQPDPAEIAEC